VGCIIRFGKFDETYVVVRCLVVVIGVHAPVGPVQFLMHHPIIFAQIISPEIGAWHLKDTMCGFVVGEKRTLPYWDSSTNTYIPVKMILGVIKTPPQIGLPSFIPSQFKATM
jgi:hypothetical protein